MKKLFLLIIYLILVVTISSPYSYAIPAFARKYNMSCKTCHTPFPYLKPYGEEFAGNGFVLSDQEAPRYYVETGDPELSLIRDIPLAFRLDGYLTYNESKNERTDFSTPVLFKLLTGGSITKDVAYYVYYILENGEAGKIEDAWLMFNDLFGSDLDVTVGQFQVSDPLFKRELRLTRQDYLIYKVRPGFSQIDLTYDRGIMFGYGFETGTDLVLEILNGSGIGEGVSGIFDKDEYKNIFGRVSQGIGEHLRLGGMIYTGKERHVRFQSEVNKVLMFGGDATINFDRFELNVQYVQREDDNPYFSLSDLNDTFISKGAFAELIYRPLGDDSKWYGAFLFNLVETEYSTINSLTGHFGYLLSRNLRLAGEAGYDLKGKYVKGSLGFVTAF
jgi:hypothetical protein